MNIEERRVKSAFSQLIASILLTEGLNKRHQPAQNVCNMNAAWLSINSKMQTSRVNINAGHGIIVSCERRPLHGTYLFGNLVCVDPTKLAH